MSDNDNSQSGAVSKPSRRRRLYMALLAAVIAITGVCWLVYSTNRVYYITYRTYRTLSAFIDSGSSAEGNLVTELKGTLKSGQTNVSFTGKALLRSYTSAEGMPSLDWRLELNSDIGNVEIVYRNDIWIHLPGANVVLVGTSSTGDHKRASMHAARKEVLEASMLDLGYLFAGAIPIIEKCDLSLIGASKSPGGTLYQVAVSPKENFASGLVIRECTVEIDSSEWIPMHAVIEGRYDATDFLLSLSLQNCDQNSLLSADDFIFKKDLKTSEMRMRKKELWKFLKTALATYPAEFPEKGDGAGEPDPGD